VPPEGSSALLYGGHLYIQYIMLCYDCQAPEPGRQRPADLPRQSSRCRPTGRI